MPRHKVKSSTRLETPGYFFLGILHLFIADPAWCLFHIKVGHVLSYIEWQVDTMAIVYSQPPWKYDSTCDDYMK